MRRPQGSIKNKITVVFDGQEGIAYGLQTPPFVRVLFSAGETADDKIRTLVHASSNKKSLIVVTNDRELGYAVKALGSRCISVEQFLKKGAISLQKASPSKKKRRPLYEEKHISKIKEYRITTELEKIWLKHEKGEGTQKR